MAQFKENDSLSDTLLKHSIYLKFLVPNIGDAQIAIIDRNNAHLRGEILEFIDNNQNIRLTKKQQQRIKSFRNKVKRIRGGSINAAYKDFLKDMIELSKKEQRYTTNAVGFYSDIRLEEDSDSAIERIVAFTPILGESIESIYSRLEDDDTDRIVKKVVNGIEAGDSRAKIEKDVFGTKALGYADGVLHVTRNYINNKNRDSGSVRTIMTGVLDSANQNLYKKESSEIRYVIYVAILDSLTSEICEDRAGREYNVRGVVPTLPAHDNCRTHYEPKIVGENETILGFAQWFSTQDKGFQRFVLGDTQYKKYSSGELKVSKFVKGSKKTLTMDEVFEL